MASVDATLPAPDAPTGVRQSDTDDGSSGSGNARAPTDPPDGPGRAQPQNSIAEEDRGSQHDGEGDDDEDHEDDDKEDEEEDSEDEDEGEDGGEGGSSKKGSRPGRPDGFTGEPHQFLTDALPTFSAVRADRSVGLRLRHHEFWTSFLARFWDKFDWHMFSRKKRASETQDKVMKRINKKIQRWMRWKTRSGIALGKNPFSQACVDLRKRKGNAPKRLPAWQVWQRDHREEVRQAAGVGAHISQLNSTAARLFREQPEDVQEHARKVAQEEHAHAKAIFDDANTGKPSDDPAEQARARDRIAMNVTPMLKLLGEYTGFQCLTMVGAKANEDGRGVTFAAVHVGETAGPFPKNFGTHDPVKFQRWSEMFCEFAQVVGQSLADTALASTTSAAVPSLPTPAGSSSLAASTAAPQPDSEAQPNDVDVPDPSPWDVDLPEDIQQSVLVQNQRLYPVLVAHIKTLSTIARRAELERLAPMDDTDLETQEWVLKYRRAQEEDREEQDAEDATPPPAKKKAAATGAQPRPKGTKPKPRARPKPRRDDVQPPTTPTPPTDVQAEANTGAGRPVSPVPPLVRLASHTSSQPPTSPTLGPHTSLPQTPQLPPRPPLPTSQQDAQTPPAPSPRPPPLPGSPSQAPQPPTAPLQQPRLPTPPLQPPPQPTPPTESSQSPPQAPAPAPRVPTPPSVAQQVLPLVLDLSDAPAYITDHYNKLNEAMVPPEANVAWNAALRDWIALERSLLFENSRLALPSTHRPAEIAEWIRHARAGVIEVRRAKYAEEWLAWWEGMAPGWREREDGWPLVGGDGDWSELIRSGPNGFLTVLMSLIGLQEVAEQELWLKAVRDVAWTLEHVKNAAANGIRGTKRAPPPSGSKTANKRRKRG